jgi:hypothetical protein
MSSNGVRFYRLQPDDASISLVAAWKKETPSPALRAFLDLVNANAAQIRKEDRASLKDSPRATSQSARRSR